MSHITITAFKWVPPFAQGLVRDLRVRWALEEAGLPYEEQLLGPGEQDSPAHRAVQPFGQVPVYQEGDLTLFESGAIVMHVAQKSAALLPPDVSARAQVLQWMFAALNSIEPHVLNVTSLDHFFAAEEWAKGRRPSAEQMLHKRLQGLSKALGSRDYLVEGFTAADLVMTTVLRFLRHTNVVAGYANLAALQARCEARPAFQRALQVQMTNFEKFAPKAA
ncbi:MAG: glutathione S-transferase family protein [Variovorax sp.]